MTEYRVLSNTYESNEDATEFARRWACDHPNQPVKVLDAETEEVITTITGQVSP